MPFTETITSRTNARLRALRASFSGKASRPGELIGLEGEHLIVEALRSGITLEAVFLREGSEEILARPGLEVLRSMDVFVVSRAVYLGAMETLSPQGIAAMISIPDDKTLQPAANELMLVLEAVQDPGNLGTLLRSAEAFGATSVLLTPDCANRWSPKVVRASAGSVFRMPASRARLKTIVEGLRGSGVTTYAAVAHGERSLSLLEANFAARAAVLIGNEGAGLTAEAIAAADVRLTIPCAVESLNAAVAGSTILYEALRQREALRQPDSLRQPGSTQQRQAAQS